jgi:hypothetical protein
LSAAEGHCPAAFCRLATSSGDQSAAPVANSFSTKNRTARAISSGFPSRSSGVERRTASTVVAGSQWGQHRGRKALLVNPDIGVTQIAHGLGVSPAMLYR